MPSTPPATPTPVCPASYPRRVLLAVSGLSPQILTETLYALACANASSTPEQRFVPTEVHLITTTEGAQRARLTLLSSDLGWFRKLCQDYALPPIAFDTQHIHVMTDAAGQPMDDIRSPQDNQAAADFITAQVRQYTADAASALHVSIAGGRKTMGFYLGYALSLYGRAQDRMSHVLVSEPFENSLEFFYPTPYSRTLQTRDGRLADTASARVTLADIPFVSLRHGLPQALLAGNASFNATVQAAKATLAPPHLVLDLAQRCIYAGGQPVPLPAAELAFLALFARRAQQGEPPLPAPKKDLADADWGQRYLQEYRRIVGIMGDGEATERTLKQGMDGNYFSERKSKLHRNLKATLGPAAAPYCIDSGNTKPGSFALLLPADAVVFEGGG